MKHIHTFIIIFILTSSCLHSQTSKDSPFIINSGVEITKKDKEDYHKIIGELVGFFETRDQYPWENPYWDLHEETYYSCPYYDIYTVKENPYSSTPNKPTLMALTRLNKDKVKVKMGWFNITDGFADVQIIYNFMAVRKDTSFVFKNLLHHNTQDWKEKQVGKIKYIYYPDFPFNTEKAKLFSAFNREIAVFFEEPIIEATYFIAQDVKHLMEIRGFDFHRRMFYQDLTGGETFSHDKLIFSGNNSEIYRHELLHLYTFWYFPEHHRIINEGICTLFGGSKGLTYEQHLEKLKKHLQKNKIDIFEKLFHSYYVMDEKTTLLYTAGAFLCDLALQKCGKEGLFDLLNAGSSTEELIQAIEFIFGIDRENFNTFFMEELNRHKPSQVQL